MSMDSKFFVSQVKAECPCCSLTIVPRSATAWRYFGTGTRLTLLSCANHRGLYGYEWAWWCPDATTYITTMWFASHSCRALV